MKMQKISSVILAGIMAASAIPFSADTIPCNVFTTNAAEESSGTEIISGECGESSSFTLDSEGTLIISGTGSIFFTCGTGECTRWGGYYDSIKKVIIEDGITFIGDYAFSGCTSLYSVTIPKSVVEIGEFAFDDCMYLTSVRIENPECIIPMSDSTINNGIIPALGTNHFDGTIYGYADSTAEMYAVKYGCNFEAIDTVVSGECDNGFVDDEKACWSLENGVLTISGKGTVYCHRDYAPNGIVGFSPVWNKYNKKIKEVVVEEGITGLQHYCFAWLDNLEKITLPESLETIGGNAFRFCPSLKEIYIPKNVSKIGKNAIESDIKITVDPENPHLIYDNSNYSFFNKDKTKLIYTSSCINYIVPDGIEIIGDHAFNENRHSFIFLPDSVTTIGMSAFRVCEITALDLPESLTEIGQYAFECSSLETIKIPAGVKKISAFAFSCNYYLENVIIEEGVEELDYACFSDCPNLAEVVLPLSLKSVETGAFNYCDALDSLTFLNPDCEIKDSNSIPKETTIIGYDNSTAQEYAEKYNRKFTSLGEYQKTLIRSGDCGENATYAFYDNEELLVSGTGAVDSENCPIFSNVKKVIIEDGITKISGNLFRNLGECTSIKLPDSLTHIQFGAFKKNKSLPSIVIPEGVTHIGKEVFEECTSLTDVTLPDSLRVIDEFAFADCDSLNEVTLPKGVSRIREGAFAACDNLKKITFLNPECIIFDHEFTTGNDAKIIGYDGSTAEAYAKKYSKEFVSLGKAPVIENTKFIIEEGTCGSDATWILDSEGILTVSGEGDISVEPVVWYYDYKNSSNEWGLQHVDDVKEVIVNNGIKSLGGNTFYGWESLSSVTLSESVSLISNTSFKNCSNLTQVIIKNPECIIEEKTTVPLIIGYKGSTAEKYAEENDIPFKALEETPIIKTLNGDANCDGIVSIADAAAIYQALGNPDKYSLSEQGSINADVADNGNGITANDAIMIQKMSIGLV